VPGFLSQMKTVFGMEPALEISKKHCLVRLVSVTTAIIVVKIAMEHYQVIVIIAIQLISEQSHLIHVLVMLAMLMLELRCALHASFI